MIIGIAGRIASGKDYARGFFEKKGFIVLSFAGVLREEAANRRMEISRKNLQDLGNLLRQERGGGILAEMLVAKIEPGKNYVIEGIRNPYEILELKKLKDFHLISLDAPREQRFKRMLARSKDSDVKTWDEFIKVDDRDFCETDSSGQLIKAGQQSRMCMEIADFHIMNDSSVEEFEKKLETVYGKIVEK